MLLHDYEYLLKLAKNMTGWIDENGNDVDGLFTWKTVGQGAATHVVAAFDPSIVGMSR